MVVSRRLILAALPLASAGASLIAWTCLTAQGTTSQTATTVAVVGLGTSLYLPASLGIPMAYARWIRDDTAESGEAFSPIMRGLLMTATTVALVVSLLLFVRDAESVNAPVAATISLGVATAQLTTEARIKESLVLGVVGAGFGPAAPTAGAVASLFQANFVPALYGCLAACSVGALLTMIATKPKVLQPRRLYGGRELRMLINCLRLSMPLVPHVFALGVLCQAPRTFGSLLSLSDKQLVEVNNLTIIVGVGISVANGFHGVWSTQLLLSPLQADSRRKMVRKYTTLGLSLTIAVMFVLWVAHLTLLSESTSVSAIALGAAALTPLFLCLYYLSSTLMFSIRGSGGLALLSVTGLALFASLFIFLPHSAQTLVLAQAGVLAAIALAASVRGQRLWSQYLRTIDKRDPVQTFSEVSRFETL